MILGRQVVTIFGKCEKLFKSNQYMESIVLCHRGLTPFIRYK